MDIDNQPEKQIKKTLKEIIDEYINGNIWFARTLVEFVERHEKLDARVALLETKRQRVD